MDNDIDLTGIILPEKGTPKYNIRALYEYCKANSIELPLPDNSPIWDQFYIGVY